MQESAWNHGYSRANGITIHHVRPGAVPGAVPGAGRPLVLLHGWPEFWYVYHKNIPALAEHFDVIVPDLRGFGDTDKPGLPDPPGNLLDAMVEGLRGLADALELERFGFVSHDVGYFVAQAFAGKYPESIIALSGYPFVFKPPTLLLGRAGDHRRRLLSTANHGRGTSREGSPVRCVRYAASFDKG